MRPLPFSTQVEKVANGPDEVPLENASRRHEVLREKRRECSRPGLEPVATVDLEKTRDMAQSQHRERSDFGRNFT